MTAQKLALELYTALERIAHGDIKPDEVQNYAEAVLTDLGLWEPEQ